jgi:membrane protein DedA with SNARE-associated domain
MVGLVSNYIEHWTYAGLLVVLILCGLGFPLPEDVALLAGGFLAHRGVTQYPYTIAVALVGVVTGDHSLFFLGRKFGMRIMRYFGVGKPDYEMKMERMRVFMARHGTRTIFYARFLAGLRALIYLSAGSLGVPPLRFFIYDLMGALISVPVVVSLGYIFGDELEVTIKWIGGFDKVLIFAAVLSVAIYASRRYVTRPTGGS